jgi:hypothetical protein
LAAFEVNRIEVSGHLRISGPSRELGMLDDDVCAE